MRSGPHRPLLPLLLSLAVVAAWAPHAAQAQHSDEHRSTTWATGPNRGGASELGATEEADLESTAGGWTSLAAEAERTPSAQVRRGGGEGAPAYLMLRGSDPAHVLVLLDRMPVHGALDTSFDLSLIPVELLGSMTVYRSNAPVQLGAPRPGGMVHLETRFLDDDGARISLTAGSYDTRRIHYAQQWRGRSGSTLMSVLYRGAQNDFEFFDDNGTPLNAGDDATSRRRNAHAASGSFLIRNRIRTAKWRLTSMLLGGAGSGGVPGIVSAPALHTSRQRLRAQFGFRAQRPRWPGDNSDLELVGGLSFDRRQYTDSRDELGVGAQELTERARLSMLGARTTHWLGKHTELATVLDWTAEAYRPQDAQQQPVVTRSQRHTLAAGLQTTFRFADRRLSLDLGTRVDLLLDRVARLGGAFTGAEQSLLWSPRGGISVNPIQTGPLRLQLYASFGLADRAPGFFELYGDRGTSSGNPDLRHERRLGYDVGARSVYTGEEFGWALSYGWFDRHADDLIVFVENGVGVAVPQNIAEARLRGHELAAEFNWGTHIRVAAQYTFLDALNREAAGSRYALPYRARHTWSAELGGGWAWFGASWRASGSSESFLDKRELRPLPARTIHNVELRFRPPALWSPELTIAVNNVFDDRTNEVELPDGGRPRSVPAAISDYVGYPLPGRAYYVTLSMTPGLSERRDR